MLIGNQSVLHKMVSRKIGGQIAAGDRANWNSSGSMRNWGAQTGVDWKLAAVPYGYSAGGARLLPRKVGAMVARRTATARASQVANASAGLPGTGLATALSTQALAGLLRANMAGSASAQSSQSATMIGVFAGTGSAIAQTSQFATLIALLNGTGLATATASQTADGVLAVNMTGSAAAIADAVGVLSSVLQGSGVAFAVSDQSGVLIGARFGGGIAIALASSAAEMAAVGFMEGTAQAVASGTGSMYAIGYMTGSTIDDTVLTVDAIVAGVVSGLEAAGTGLTPEQATQLRELWRKEGLDPTKLVTHTPSSIKVGDPLAPDFEIALTGNRKTLTIMERQ